MAYEKLVQVAVDIINCEDGAPTPHAFLSRINEMHAKGAISKAQYGNLMIYVEDLV